MKFPKLGRKVTPPPPSPFISQKEAKRRAEKQIADLAKFLKAHPEIPVSERQEMNRADITKKLLATRLRGNIPPMPSKRIKVETSIEKVGFTATGGKAFPKWVCMDCDREGDGVFVFEHDFVESPRFCPMCGKKAGV